MAAQDPNAARKLARDDAETFLGRDDKRGKMNEYLNELKAMDVSQQDPKKLRDERDFSVSYGYSRWWFVWTNYGWWFSGHGR